MSLLRARLLRLLTLAIVAPFALWAPRAAFAGEPLLVLATASLAGPMEAIAARFSRATGVRVNVSHAASSTLARQIEQGAPAAVFISANPQWMDYLTSRGLVLEDTRFDWLGNHLVVVSAAAERRTDDLATTLARGRVAIGEPSHVPAGIYAREALRTLGLWDTVEARAVRADNVRAALVMVARGEVAHGIVYATDARLESDVAVIAALPDDSHAPIRYPAAAMRPAHPDAQAFLAFLRSPAVSDLMREAGFDVIAEQQPGIPGSGAVRAARQP